VLDQVLIFDVDTVMSSAPFAHADNHWQPKGICFHLGTTTIISTETSTLLPGIQHGFSVGITNAHT